MRLTVETELVTETCSNCGILFAMTKNFQDEKLRYRDNHNRRSFYCPNGHQQHYLGETEEARLRRQAKQLRADADRERRWRREAQDREQKANRRANGYKGHATKLTKRVKAGVCICCNRTFQDLARHMATKHPTLTPLELSADEQATLQ